MSIFLKSLQLAAPLLLLTALGYILKRVNILDKDSSVKLSKLVLNVILPVSIFNYIYNCDLENAFNTKLVVFMCVCTIVLIGINILLALLFTRERRKLSALMQAGYWANMSIFALPLAISIFGDSLASEMSLVLAFLTPITNIASMCIFEFFDEDKVSTTKEILKFLKSPLMIAIGLGAILNALNITIPSVIDETLQYIGKSITAISLINLGSGFDFKVNKKIIKLAAVAVVIKLIVSPLLMIPTGALLGFRDMEMVIIFAIASAPIATSTYSIAVCYDTDISITSCAVVYSYVFCALTIPSILSLITYLGLI